jgi:phosphoglycolate phosphatase
MSTAAPRPQLLVLWDIDHTLIETRGVGRAIYDRAFPVATGKPLAELAEIAGRTELDIMAESLKANGVDASDETVQKLAAALTQGYEDARDELRTKGRMLPGADMALQALAADPAVHQTVLSGNLRAVARIKLEVFGLSSYLDLQAGAYGDDHAERTRLVGIAQQRAGQRAGTTFSDEATVLVGDTPNDVRAGLTAGVRVVGVATGKSDVAELSGAGAQWAIGALPEIVPIVHQLHRSL